MTPYRTPAHPESAENPTPPAPRHCPCGAPLLRLGVATCRACERAAGRPQDASGRRRAGVVAALAASALLAAPVAALVLPLWLGRTPSPDPELQAIEMVQAPLLAEHERVLQCEAAQLGVARESLPPFNDVTCCGVCGLTDGGAMP